jgi:hypothetical protein
MRWHQGHGVARCGGVQVELRYPPRIAGAEEVTQLDYAPGSFSEVRTDRGPIRELSLREIGAILAILHRMSVAGRDAVEKDAP